MSNRSIRLLGLIFLGSLILCLSLGKVAAQTFNPDRQVQQGVERYESGDYQGAIALWEVVLTDYQKTNNPTNTAIVKENLARAYQQVGQTDKAIEYWEQLKAYYLQQGDAVKVGRLLTEQAQANILEGKILQAFSLLCGSIETDCLPETALKIAFQTQDREGEIAAKGSLGEVYRLQGNYEKAIEILETAEKIEKIENTAYRIPLQNSLGNAYLAKAQRADGLAKLAAQRNNEEATKRLQEEAKEAYRQALAYFQSNLQLASERELKLDKMKSLLNLIQLAYRSQKLSLVSREELDNQLQQASILLDRLPDSPTKVYAAIDLAYPPDAAQNITAPLAQCAYPPQLPNATPEELLDKAVNIARKLDRPRSETFALGALGHFYECRGDYKQALEYTQKALSIADLNLANKDSVYLWEWQTGRIFKAQADNLRKQEQESAANDKEERAIAAFQRAFAYLEQIRSDILIADRDVQFDFRDTIEPIYRQLAQLRLKLASLNPNDSPQQKQELTLAVETIDSLRLAELQNLLGSDCDLTIIPRQQVDRSIAKDTAVFSSIIFDDRTFILLSLPNGTIRIHEILQDRQTIEENIKQLRQGLLAKETINYDTQQAKKLYDWFISNLAKELNPEQIKTLVFIQDGIFRTVPMAALYDGNQFLVEKYALATVPSISLVASQKANLKKSNTLILGITKEAEFDERKFKALLNVPLEVEEIQNQFVKHKSLLDENFNQENLKQEFDRSVYQIVHIATHAQFGTTPEDTFLVAGNNQKITIKELEAALRQLNVGSNSVELLALSACQTAEGDDRAALGLAGVAVQAGVKSTLASLWSVSDESTLTLVKEFYDNIVKKGLSKAEALQEAQIKLIKAKESQEINAQYDHPYYWAPFILIGNWS
jgi:CHAT domain-containing protein